MSDEFKKMVEKIKPLDTYNPFDDAMKNLNSASAFQNVLKNINSSGFPDLKQYSFPELQHSKYDPKLPKVPSSEERNHYQSAGVLMKSLANAIADWRKQLPEGVQPAVLALLNGGMQIDVTTLAQESFHGIRVEGTINGLPCIVLAHQSTVQLMCYVQPINPPEVPKRKIGFIIDGESSEV